MLKKRILLLWSLVTIVVLGIGFGIYKGLQIGISYLNNELEITNKTFEVYESNYDMNMKKWEETYDKKYLEKAGYWLEKMKNLTGQN
jgi:hypothetical protein